MNHSSLVSFHSCWQELESGEKLPLRNRRCLEFSFFPFADPGRFSEESPLVSEVEATDKLSIRDHSSLSSWIKTFDDRTF